MVVEKEGNKCGDGGGSTDLCPLHPPHLVLSELEMKNDKSEIHCIYCDVLLSHGAVENFR